MPLTSTAPDALARVYAKSLFDLAMSEGGGQAGAESALGELEDILELARDNPQFSEFLASQVLTLDDRARVLNTIFKQRASPLTLKFLLLLNSKRRLGHLPAIAAALDEIVQAAFGRVEVDLYTPGPVSPEELSAIRDRLRSALGREPVLHPYTDPSMLGGLRLQIGDQLIDASLATRLRRMRDQLATTGLAAVRARAARILDEPSGNGVV